MAAALHYSTVLLLCCRHGNAAGPFKSINQACWWSFLLFLFFFCAIKLNVENPSIFCVFAGGGLICSVGLKNSLWYLERVQLVSRSIWKTQSWVHMAFNTWASCVWGFWGDNRWGIISFTSARLRRAAGVEKWEKPREGTSVPQTLSACHCAALFLCWCRTPCQTAVILLARRDKHSCSTPPLQ